MSGSVLMSPLDVMRRADRWVGRRSGRRRILVDARTPVNYAIVAPVHRAMARDPRIEFHFTASEAPAHLRDVYREAPGDLRLLAPGRAALMRFDAYLASDFTWQWLPRGARRVQVFHGVAGKYGFDTPGPEVRHWDQIFFINRRRLRNYVASGHLAADSPAIRLIGMPKTDSVVDGTFSRDEVLASLGLDPGRPTVLYAPTWSPDSSLNTMGLELIRSLASTRAINLIVKLHDRSRDTRQRYSGRVDWIAALQPLLEPGRTVLAPGHDISPLLVASDLMITDHSSAGFEFLLRDRPLVRIHQPALLRNARIHPDYVDLLASASHSARSPSEVVAAVWRGLERPEIKSDDRQRVAQELFYEPGTATRRAIFALYDVIDLEPWATFAPDEAMEAVCR